MLQFLFILLSGITGFTLAGYPEHTSGNNINSDGQSYGYGYSGSFSGAGPNLQNIPFSQGFDFNNLFENFNKFQRHLFDHGDGAYSYSHTHSSTNGKVDASSSITFNNGRKDLSKGIQSQSAFVQNNAQARSNFPETAGGYAGGYGFGNENSGSFSGSFPELYPDGTSFQFIPGSDVTGEFTPKGNGATAFGSVGSDGVRQGAFVYPENPNKPNVNVRFGADQPSDGFKSVFTSSSSYTTNVNGKPKTVQKASTTVNDNGKVTTYTRESPRE
ncbi:uncharacterized protein LOC130450529 isoform X1 [Diorhabda sublineata]|uniref:uncharacterized protein LOC130450529 isoform X1 n=1 Tax=Diorhabda sublineata TaxID=1163346 RepID=UPI0024E14FBF|nr:uncharacterized protein LOC130450529 isoform X1 [Diorhabda sublineata]